MNPLRKAALGTVFVLAECWITQELKLRADLRPQNFQIFYVQTTKDMRKRMKKITQKVFLQDALRNGVTHFNPQSTGEKMITQPHVVQLGRKCSFLPCAQKEKEVGLDTPLAGSLILFTRRDGSFSFPHISPNVPLGSSSCPLPQKTSLHASQTRQDTPS